MDMASYLRSSRWVETQVVHVKLMAVLRSNPEMSRADQMSLWQDAHLRRGRFALEQIAEEAKKDEKRNDIIATIASLWMYESLLLLEETSTMPVAVRPILSTLSNIQKNEWSYDTMLYTLAIHLHTGLPQKEITQIEIITPLSKYKRSSKNEFIVILPVEVEKGIEEWRAFHLELEKGGIYVCTNLACKQSTVNYLETYPQLLRTVMAYIEKIDQVWFRCRSCGYHRSVDKKGTSEGNCTYCDHPSDDTQHRVYCAAGGHDCEAREFARRADYRSETCDDCTRVAHEKKYKGGLRAFLEAMKAAKTHSTPTEGDVESRLKNCLEEDNAAGKFISVESEADLRSKISNDLLSERANRVQDSEDQPLCAQTSA